MSQSSNSTKASAATTAQELKPIRITFSFNDPDFRKGDEGVLTGEMLSDASLLEVRLASGKCVWVPRGNIEVLNS